MQPVGMSCSCLELSTAIADYADVSRSQRDSHLLWAATPPDVRKVSDFPHGGFASEGLRPIAGAQPHNIGQELRKGPAFPHIKRRSRRFPSSYHLRLLDPVQYVSVFAHCRVPARLQKRRYLNLTGLIVDGQGWRGPTDL